MKTFSSTIRKNLLLSLSVFLLVGGSAIYLIVYNLERVEANFESIKVNETLSEDVEAERVRFSLEFEKQNSNEQQMYNAVLSQTNALIALLDIEGIAPTEYEISHELIPPVNDDDKFRMIQTILVDSENTQAAAAIEKETSKMKGIAFDDLEFGFSDVRPVVFDLKNRVLENARLSAEKQVEKLGNEAIGIESINGNSEIELYNPSPMHLNQKSDQDPYFISSDNPDNAVVPMEETVTIEYSFK